jgi:putative FmdB family regulatory protein
MPLYEYLCEDCGQRVELRRRFDDNSTPRCPNCQGGNLARRFSRVAVVKSEQDRTTDLSWVDRDLAGRLKKKASGKLNPPLQDTLDRMESS